MNAFFGLDTNYEQSNFNEISAEDLVLISGGTDSGSFLECAAAIGVGAMAGGAALAGFGFTFSFGNPVVAAGTGLVGAGAGAYTALHSSACG